MNINHLNYEEYFLLYADGELKAEERRQVETFITQHPKFKKELDDLLMTIQQPDESQILKDKSFLFQTPAKLFINKENYEERFVLYHDEELTDEEKKLTEDFLGKHRALQQEFDLISNAKLEAETTVIFPDKKSLYKHETKIIRVNFYRMAAAAAVLGFLIWFGYPFHSEKNAPPSVALNETKTSVQPSIVKEQPKETVSVPKDKKPMADEEQTETVEIKQKPAIAQTIKQQEKHPLIETEKEEITAQKIEKEKEPDEMTAIVTRVPSLEKEINIEPSKTLTHTDIDLTPQISEQKINAQYASNISNQNMETHTDGLLGSSIDELKRSKVGGFIKQVRRVIDRNNPINRLLNED